MDRQVAFVFRSLIKEIEESCQRAWHACGAKEFAEEVGELPEYGKCVLGQHTVSLYQLPSDKRFQGVLRQYSSGTPLTSIYLQLGQACQRYFDVKMKESRAFCLKYGIPLSELDRYVDSRGHMVQILREGFFQEFSQLQFPNLVSKPMHRPQSDLSHTAPANTLRAPPLPQIKATVFSSLPGESSVGDVSLSEDDPSSPPSGFDDDSHKPDPSEDLGSDDLFFSGIRPQSQWVEDWSDDNKGPPSDWVEEEEEDADPFGESGEYDHLYEAVGDG